MFRHRFSSPLPIVVKVTLEEEEVTHSSFEHALDGYFTLEAVSDAPSERLWPLLLRWSEAYLEGREPEEALPLRMEHLPPFTRQVLNHLRQISFGHTQSYTQIARLLGCPQGARAVGNACGKNLLPLFIPCHRVLKNNAYLGGFSGGLPIKRLLLTHELVEFKE